MPHGLEHVSETPPDLTVALPLDVQDTGLMTRGTTSSILRMASWCTPQPVWVW